MIEYFDIEREARALQRRLLDESPRLWPEGAPTLLAMLDPASAARVLGVKYEIYPELGRFGSRSGRFEVAGLIDRSLNAIAVSQRFRPEVMRFTGAHEIGHWLLHSGEVMHRDRPIDGVRHDRTPRPRNEREADYFAACFLVPRKLLTQAFESTFRTRVPLVLDDSVAFWLCPDDPESLLRPDVGSLEFALAVASATSYAGRHVLSLAKQFGVSVTTMAVRLREVRLIRE